jgi:hypothetical protein
MESSSNENIHDNTEENILSDNLHDKVIMEIPTVKPRESIIEQICSFLMYIIHLLQMYYKIIIDEYNNHNTVDKTV